jgi:hypothetical protein
MNSCYVSIIDTGGSEGGAEKEIGDTGLKLFRLAGSNFSYRTILAGYFAIQIPMWTASANCQRRSRNNAQYNQCLQDRLREQDQGR